MVPIIMYSLRTRSSWLLSYLGTVGDTLAVTALAVLTPLAVVAHGLPNAGRVTGLEFVYVLSRSGSTLCAMRDKVGIDYWTCTHSVPPVEGS